MKKKSSTKDLALSSNERLFIKNKSIFIPKKYSNLKPNTFKIYTFHAGFKKNSKDLLIIVFNDPTKMACVYSKTSTPSAPIIWDKKNNKGIVKAVIVNSGNANAHTGIKGIKVIDNYVNYASKILGCKKGEVFVSSTGVIGEHLEPNLIKNKIAKIYKTPHGDLLDAAKAIITTDTYLKTSIIKIKIDNKIIKIYGIAKGSGMIQPNMGTMLAYIFIEAHIPEKILNKILSLNLDDTFNSISIDSDTSTSDTLALFSINKNKINLKNNRNFKIINKAIKELMMDLALKVVKDGEGISKVIKINITHCKSKDQAKKIGFSVINSPLVKTAISGEDANWGRIIAAIGKSEQKINQNHIKILFGNNLVCEKGSIYKKINTNKINKYMKNKIIEITLNLQNGKYNHTLYGNDLTYEYIRINSDYRS